MSQLDFFSSHLESEHASAIIARTRDTGILPEEGEVRDFTEDQRRSLGEAFIAGLHAVDARAGASFRAHFRARGWPFAWYQDWKPATRAETDLSNGIDEALEVVARYYPAILNRGLDRNEDMGLLMSSGVANSEGVRVKRQPYSSDLVLVTVCCVSGPTNFDVSSGTVEFEPGSKSHRFHLLYRELPSLERLSGDLAAYPVVSAANNRDDAPNGNKVWMSEGWTGPSETRPRLHKPWDTIPGPHAPLDLKLAC